MGIQVLATPAERLAFGNLLKKIEIPQPSLDAEGRVIVTEYSYYTQGNRLRLQKGPYYADLALLLPLPNQEIGEVSYEYDSKGNLTKIIYPEVKKPDGTSQSLEPMTFIHSDNGLITDVVVGPVHTQLMYYSDILRSGFVKDMIEDLGGVARKTNYQVDNIGRITQVNDHYGAKTDIEWTKFDAPKLITLPETTTPGTIRPTISYTYNRNRQATKKNEEIKLHDGTPSGWSTCSNISL